MDQSSRTEIVKWTTERSAEGALVRRAAELLLAGEVIAFPTDTVYGIAADPTNEDAVRRLYAIKERPPEKAIALLLAEATHLDAITDPEIPELRALVEAYWPGALTVVVPALPDAAVATGQPISTVGLRMPDHMIPLAIIEELGRPIATTSANLSGEPSAITAEEVDRQIGDRIALIIDGGPCPGGRDSTVVDITTSPPTVRRLGAISLKELTQTLGDVILPQKKT